MNRLMKDLAIDRAKDPMTFADNFQPGEDDDDDDDDDGDGGILDRSDERAPGDYIDVTRVRRRDNEGFSWPRPG